MYKYYNTQLNKCDVFDELYNTLLTTMTKGYLQ